MWKFLLKKWKGLDTKKKLIVLGVATVIALFPVIFILVLISPPKCDLLFYKPPPEPNDSNSSSVTITFICILLLPHTNNASP